jgi:hypothetical protein
MRGWRRHRIPAAVGAVLLAAVLSGCQATSTPRTSLVIQTGLASAVDGAILIEANGWTYGVPLDGVRWVDRLGTWQTGGRPECLMPGPDRAVRFAAAEVSVEGATWRPVVWVSCQ